ncbi:MAG: hypothetical protein F4X44_10330 [Gammaproteobacteria bacterium]|nr:hypothetical protein [Gammaproteobacteria bacterium]MYD80994.1 hypothetical protein [Gammaproteobacteria bacterium]
MKVNRIETGRIPGKRKIQKTKKVPVVIPINFPKRNYSRDQWRLYILRRIVKRGDCWLWQRGNSDKPYGEIRVPMPDGTTKYLLPARVAKWADGKPKGCKVWEYAPETRFDRICGHPNCVNPRHLQPQD